MGPRLLLLWVLGGLLLLPAPSFAQRKNRRGGGRPAQKAPRRAAPKATPAPPPAAQVERKAEDARPAGKGEEERDLKRGERVEFDGRLIEGQTAASGAIYLFERLPSELRSMVSERRSYRREVLETLYPNGVAPPPESRGDKGAR